MDPLEDFPHVLAWHKRMTACPAFCRSWELREKGIKEQNLTAGADVSSCYGGGGEGEGREGDLEGGG